MHSVIQITLYMSITTKIQSNLERLASKRYNDTKLQGLNHQHKSSTVSLEFSSLFFLVNNNLF